MTNTPKPMITTPCGTDRHSDCRSGVCACECHKCDAHRDGIVHYRAAYGEYECNTYRDRVLFTHVVRGPK